MDNIIYRSRSFEEMKVGETVSLTRVSVCDETSLFDEILGHPSRAPALLRSEPQGVPIAGDGLWINALVSTLIETCLPGPGSVFKSLQLEYLDVVMPDIEITATVTIAEKLPGIRAVRLDIGCVDANDVEIARGQAVVQPSEDQKTWAREQDAEHGRFSPFIEKARNLPIMRVAIVHPCSTSALEAAIEVRDEGLLEPLLVGPEQKIRAIAKASNISLEGVAIENAEHSHAAAARAVQLAVSGKVSVLMKGSLHSDELMGAVLADGAGLKTERRISHVYLMDVPAYPRPLIITDAAINILPTLEQKRDICQNAIDFMLKIGITEPKVAILAAVETVNPKMPATLDAAALSVMAARGQITGAKVDGPLAFDNAINFEAARTKGIISSVAGQADILVVPDLESGNMLAKQLIYFTGADAAGLVLGARVPIILTSRSDSVKVRVASAAFAKLSAAVSPPIALKIA
jgi:phosphate acetyltransferase